MRARLKATIQLGLMEQYEFGEYNVNILTPRGDAVAAKVKKLEEALGESSVSSPCARVGHPPVPLDQYIIPLGSLEILLPNLCIS